MLQLQRTAISPNDCTKDFCKTTQWFLPSIRDLQNIYLQETQIKASLTLLKGNSARLQGASIIVIYRV